VGINSGKLVEKPVQFVQVLMRDYFLFALAQLLFSVPN